MGYVDEIDTKRQVAFPHPVTGDPVFLVTDPPHLVKTLANALDRTKKQSDNSKQRRPMVKFVDGKARHLGLKVLWDVRQRRNAGGSKAGVTTDKFKKEDFFPTPSTRMRVANAARVLSGTSARYLREDRHEATNTGFIDYCSKINRYFDIANGKAGPVKAPESPLLAELDDVVQWFEDWETDLRTRREPLDEAFVPKATFQGVQSIRALTWCCRFYLAKHPKLLILLQQQ